MAAIVGIPERLRYMKLVHPWSYQGVAFLVPMPDTSRNYVDAIIKPFKLEVRTCLIILAMKNNRDYSFSI